MILIIILSIIPIVIWSFMMPLGVRFFDFVSTMTSIGQILGLLGMTLFSINLILSGRFKFLDKYFKGLDKVYVNHSIIGAIAFSMILFHPIFLVIKYITFSLREASLLFVPFVNMSITWGIISLFIMIVLISLTFYVKLKYHKWKISHKFMTVAFLFAILHVLFISSDITRNHLLSFYILFLAAIGLIISVRRAFLSKFLIKKMKYKVKQIKFLNKDIFEIEMIPVEEKLVFKGGQFIFISFEQEKLKESHPFSVSSGESDENIKLTIKSFGDFTNELKNLKPDTVALIEGPYGNFSYKNAENKNQIWIAGGIGVTPFMSMAKTLDENYNIDLFYCVKEKSEAVFLDDFIKISEDNKNFKVNLWCSSEKGFITAGEISRISNQILEKDIFLCGPTMFMENLEKQFVSLNVDNKKIHYENFSL